MRRIKNGPYTLYRSENMEVLSKRKDKSIHVLISDPPYGLTSIPPDATAMLKAWAKGKDYKGKATKGYFGKDWDNSVPQPSFWKEAYRVLKPGGWCLAFFSARTYDIGTLAIRMAGFQVHDCIQWVYGISSPKNMRIDRYIDRKLGVDIKKHYVHMGGNHPQTDLAKKWTGWGTSLLPRVELIALCRKPTEGTITENVMKYGVGALNIQGARIPLSNAFAHDMKQSRKRIIPIKSLNNEQFVDDNIPILNKDGRFPSHLIMDPESGKIFNASNPANEISRFFYQPKITQAEREWGTEGLPIKRTSATHSTTPLMMRKKWEGEQREDHLSTNNHPTVKPVGLMRYLIRLVAPYNTIVLDPFMGSGSTGIAAMLEGCRFVGIELDKGYFKIAESRIRFAHTIVTEHPAEKMRQLFD